MWRNRLLKNFSAAALRGISRPFDRTPVLGRGAGGRHKAGRSRNSSRYRRQQAFSVRRKASRFPSCKVHLSTAGGIPFQVLMRQQAASRAGSTPSSLRPETPWRINRVRTSPRPGGNVRAAIIADTENAYRADRLIFWRSNERAPAGGGIQEEKALLRLRTGRPTVINDEIPSRNLDHKSPGWNRPFEEKCRLSACKRHASIEPPFYRGGSASCHEQWHNENP